MKLSMTVPGQRSRLTRWDVHNHPALAVSAKLKSGDTATVLKWFTQYTSRDVKNPVEGEPQGKPEIFATGLGAVVGGTSQRVGERMGSL